MTIFLKRAYAKPESSDGTRILVDRLWPRGISKEGAKIDLWPKDLAPSKELRTWFHHDPDRWPEFQKRYLAELSALAPDTEALEAVLSLMHQGTITLVYGAKDTEHNHAIVLKAFLEAK